MRRSGRLSGISSLFLVTVAGLFILPALGFGLVNAQRRPTDDDSQLVRPSREVQGRPQEQVVTPPTAQERKAQRNTGRRLVGSPVAGLPIRTDSVPPSSPEVIAAGPISNCSANGGGGITCNLYETNAGGNPSEISNVVSLPTGVTGGYLVLKDNPAAPDNDQSQWSDVLVFAPTGGTATTVQMFSAGCNTGNPNDRSCFPSFATVISDPDSAFINETRGSATVFVAGVNIYNIFSVSDNAPNRPFTAVGSVGTVDEDSTAIVQLRNFTVTFLPGTTGSIHVRYNITAIDDISRFCPANQSVVRVRFRNSDNTGTAARVSFEIHSTNITTGGNNIVYTFTSDGKGNGGAFISASDTPAIDFDFGNNLYWIEATIFRSDPNQFADLGSIQIWEASGTPCP